MKFYGSLPILTFEDNVLNEVSHHVVDLRKLATFRSFLNDSLVFRMAMGESQGNRYEKKDVKDVNLITQYLGTWRCR